MVLNRCPSVDTLVQLELEFQYCQRSRFVYAVYQPTALGV